MVGRPKRNPGVLRKLKVHEFWWTVIFNRIRFGMRNGDDSVPEFDTPARKWRYLPKNKLWLNIETRRRFWARDWDDYAEEVEKDFTENVVAASPRDLPPEPELWRVLTSVRTRPADLLAICRRSQYLGGFHLNVLTRCAKEFCHSKLDVRYPRAGLAKGSKHRPSSEDRRTTYLARVMAGLSLRKPLAPATAVDLIRRMKHGTDCACWQCCLRGDDAS